jgi:AraC-like DNA-binding protein
VSYGNQAKPLQPASVDGAVATTTVDLTAANPSIITPTLEISGEKKALMARGKAKFADEWSHALTCQYLHKSVGSQSDAFIPATRLSTMRFLVAVDVAEADALLCGRGAGAAVRGLSGGSQTLPSIATMHRHLLNDPSLTTHLSSEASHLPTRLTTMLQTFLSAKIHVTLVFTGHDTALARAKQEQQQQQQQPPVRTPKCSCDRKLRYFGINVVNSLPMLEFRRKPTKPNCRFDVVLMSGMEPYKRLLLYLREKCPSATIAFDVAGTGDGSEEFRRLRASPFLTELGHVQAFQRQASDFSGLKLDVRDRVASGGSVTQSAQGWKEMRDQSRLQEENNVYSRVHFMGRKAEHTVFRRNLRRKPQQLERGEEAKSQWHRHSQLRKRTLLQYESAAVEAEVRFMLNSAVVVLPTDRALEATRSKLQSYQAVWGDEAVGARGAVESGLSALSSRRMVVIPRPVPIRAPVGVSRPASESVKTPPPSSFAARSGYVFPCDLYSSRDIESLFWLLEGVMPNLQKKKRKKISSEREANYSDGHSPRPSSYHLEPVTIIRVVQLDGRQLPPSSMLPSRLLEVSERAELRATTNSSNARTYATNSSASKKRPFVLLYDIPSAIASLEDRPSASINIRKPIHVGGNDTGRGSTKLIWLDIFAAADTIAKSAIFLVLAFWRSLVMGKPVGWDWSTELGQLYKKMTSSLVPTATSMATANLEDNFEEASDTSEAVSDGLLTVDGDVLRARALDEIFKLSRVAVAPLRSTEAHVAYHQIMSAMTRGVPIVSTTAATANLPSIRDGNGAPDKKRKGSHAVLVADNAEEFAEKARLLYTNAAVWVALAQHGYEYIAAEASTAAVVRQTAELLESIVLSRSTTLASAFQMHQRDAGGLEKKGSLGVSEFSQQIEFARRATAMQECSNEHTLDLLTFTSNGHGDITDDSKSRRV